jgi:hypothetical protein
MHTYMNAHKHVHSCTQEAGLVRFYNAHVCTHIKDKYKQKRTLYMYVHIYSFEKIRPNIYDLHSKVKEAF